MNKKAESKFTQNIFVKVILMIVLILALFWGINGMYLGMFFTSLTRIFNSLQILRIIYFTTGLSVVIAVILLFVKIYVKKN